MNFYVALEVISINMSKLPNGNACLYIPIPKKIDNFTF